MLSLENNARLMDLVTGTNAPMALLARLMLALGQSQAVRIKLAGSRLCKIIGNCRRRNRMTNSEVVLSRLRSCAQYDASACDHALKVLRHLLGRG